MWIIVQELKQLHAKARKRKLEVPTFVQAIPHALQRVLGPSGPRRICGVAFALMPHRMHLNKFNRSLRNHTRPGINCHRISMSNFVHFCSIMYQYRF